MFSDRLPSSFSKALPQKSWATGVKWDIHCYCSGIHALCQFTEAATGILFHNPSEWLRWQRSQSKSKSVKSGSHLNGANGQRADGYTDKHTGKQCSRQCRSGYLGLDALGFLFQLTLLRAHGKANEQGLSKGSRRERTTVCPKYLAASFPSGSPLTGPPSLHFPDTDSSHYTCRTPRPTGLSNLPKLRLQPL